ncbi:MAG: glycosyltransferase [Candidatus Omnitrophota bacterium]|nr:glycosyltransferase [Candidatus Omnitrophota bacterium]
MRILYICNALPYPPNSGGNMRSLTILKSLAKKGKVTLICRSKFAEDQVHANVQALQRYCDKVVVISANKFPPESYHGRPAPFYERLWNVLAMKPWNVQDFISDELRQALVEAAAEGVDAVFVRYPIMAYYLFVNKSLRQLLPRTIIDVDDIAINVEQRRMRAMPYSYRKFRHWLELYFLKTYYKKLKASRAVLAASADDARYLESRGYASKAYVLPNTIEIASATCPAAKAGGNSPEILFCGLLSFPHNEEAVFFFCEKIFPLIRERVPGAVFTVIGKDPAARLLKLNERPGVEIVGFVPSTQPYYERASITVVPLLNGAGTRIKILEAMAYGRPVVSTTVGAEGIAVSDKVDIRLADAADDFAACCVDLLTNQNRRQDMAEKAFALVKGNYSQGIAERVLENVLDTFDGMQEPGAGGSEGMPKYSVIMPTLNRLSSLKRAIASVEKQSVKNWELIVVDDLSDDGTKEYVQELSARDPRIKYCRLPLKCLVSVKRNHGVSIAAGEYIAFLDDDDAWRPAKLAEQGAVLEEHPEVGVVFTDGIAVCGGQVFRPTVLQRNVPEFRKWIDAERYGLSDVSGGPIDTVLLRANVVTLSSAMMRKDLFERVGGYASDLHGCEGYDLWLRSAQQTLFALVDKPLFEYTIQGNSIMGSLEDRAYARRENDAIALARNYRHVKGRSRRLLKSHIAENSRMAAWHYLRAGHFRKSRALAKLSLRFKRWQPRVAGYYAGSFLPEFLIKLCLDKSSWVGRGNEARV